MKYNDRFDPYDTRGGTYSSHKVPKWRCHTADLLDYAQEFQDENRADVVHLETSLNAAEA